MTWLAPAGFALAVLLVCLTPGVSFTLVTQRVLDAGVRGGLVVAGTVFGWSPTPCSPVSAWPPW